MTACEILLVYRRKTMTAIIMVAVCIQTEHHISACHHRTDSDVKSSFMKRTDQQISFVLIVPDRFDLFANAIVCMLLKKKKSY